MEQWPLNQPQSIPAQGGVKARWCLPVWSSGQQTAENAALDSTVARVARETEDRTDGSEGDPGLVWLSWRNIRIPSSRVRRNLRGS